MGNLVIGQMKTAHDPLPTGQLERENSAEIDRDWSPEKREKRLRPFGRPRGRIALWFLFSTKVLWGVGGWLKDAGRGSQESPGDRKPKTLATDKRV
jgi:hypothetical protein